MFMGASVNVWVSKKKKKYIYVGFNQSWYEIIFLIDRQNI